MATVSPKWTPSEVAKRLRVSPDKVRSWIRTGELRAIDVSSVGSQRKRFLVDLDDLVVFEEARAVVGARSRRRTRRRVTGVREFF